MKSEKTIVIWDFNGTILLDTHLCYEIANRMRMERSMEPIPTFEAYRAYFRFPVIEYYRDMGYTFETETYDDICEEFYRLYTEGFPFCPIRPGALDTVAMLRKAGIKQILLSATAHGRLLEQTALYGLTDSFDAIIGSENDYAGGKADVAERYLSENGIDPAQAVFIGDTDHDCDVARHVGGDCILLTGGNQNDDKLLSLGVPVLDDVQKLTELLL